jgi:hypothetical protein
MPLNRIIIDSFFHSNPMFVAKRKLWTGLNMKGSVSCWLTDIPYYAEFPNGRIVTEITVMLQTVSNKKKEDSAKNPVEGKILSVNLPMFLRIYLSLTSPGTSADGTFYKESVNLFLDMMDEAEEGVLSARGRSLHRGQGVRPVRVVGAPDQQGQPL